MLAVFLSIFAVLTSELVALTLPPVMRALATGIDLDPVMEAKRATIVYVFFVIAQVLRFSAWGYMGYLASGAWGLTPLALLFSIAPIVWMGFSVLLYINNMEEMTNTAKSALGIDKGTTSDYYEYRM